jgi:hypothetical protein
VHAHPAGDGHARSSEQHKLCGAIARWFYAIVFPVSVVHRVGEFAVPATGMTISAFFQVTMMIISIPSSVLTAPLLSLWAHPSLRIPMPSL